jgi:hypothetical protein
MKLKEGIKQGLTYLTIAGASLLGSGCKEETEPVMENYAGRNNNIDIDCNGYKAYRDSTGRVETFLESGFSNRLKFIDQEGTWGLLANGRNTFILPDSTAELINRVLAGADSLEFQLDATMFEQRQARDN